MARSAKPRSPEMSVGGHLRELRRRLFRIFLGMMVGILVGWILYEPVFQFLQKPILLAANNDRLVSLNFAGIGTAFSTQLKVSTFVGLILTFPWWIYQIGAFIAPALTKREKQIVILWLLASFPLFLAGMTLGWFFVPSAITVLTGFAPDFTSTLVNAEIYFDFILRMLLAFGIAFELPVVMVALIGLGIVASSTWLRCWKWAVLLSFVFAALASPSGDVLTMTGLAIPVLVLYFGAVGIGALIERRQLKKMGKLVVKALVG